MNQFTLKFTDFRMENSYWNFRETIQIQTRSNFKYFLMGLLLLNILDYSLDKCWPKLIISSVALFILILSCYFKHETLILIALLLYNIQQPLKQLITNEENIATFQDNYFLCLGTLGYTCIQLRVLSSLSYVKKIIALNIIFVMQIVSFSLIGLIQWRTYSNMVLSTIVILYFFFLMEREQRISFLTMHNKNLVEGILYKAVEMQSYIVHYDSNDNTFKLIGQNQTGSITENQQQDFINLSRTMKVMLTNENKIGFKNLNSIKKLSLEQYMIYLFAKKIYNWDQTFTQFEQDDPINEQLIGVNGCDVNHVSIIRAFDIKPCLIILIKENKKQTQHKSLKYRLKITNKLITQIETNIEYKLRKCLICLKQMGKQSQMHKKIDLIRYINAQMTQTYNDLYNIKDFNSINYEFSQIRHNSFSLVKCLEDCIQIVEIIQYQLYKVKIKIISKLKDDTIYSDERKVKQLIFNCLFFLVEKSTLITISVLEENDPSLNQKFIKFEFQYQGQIFTINKINNLPIINPQSLEELKHNCTKQLDLELPIALMIVRQLGPYNQIYFKQNTLTKGNSIIFYLFKQIQTSHLAPIVSLRPSQNFITNQNFFQKRSYSYKAVELFTSQEPQLETFRKISAQMISKY